MIFIGFCDLSFFNVVNDLQSLRASYLDLFRALYFSLKFFNTTSCHVCTKSDFLTDIFSVFAPFFVRLIFQTFYRSHWVPGIGWCCCFLPTFGLFISKIYTKNSDIICSRARVQVNLLFPREKNFKVDLCKT